LSFHERGSRQGEAAADRHGLPRFISAYRMQSLQMEWHWQTQTGVYESQSEEDSEIAHTHTSRNDPTDRIWNF
jgi:hypothetical protein